VSRGSLGGRHVLKALRKWERGNKTRRMLTGGESFLRRLYSGEKKMIWHWKEACLDKKRGSGNMASLWKKGQTV